MRQKYYNSLRTFYVIIRLHIYSVNMSAAVLLSMGRNLPYIISTSNPPFGCVSLRQSVPSNKKDRPIILKTMVTSGNNQFTCLDQQQRNTTFQSFLLLPTPLPYPSDLSRNTYRQTSCQLKVRTLLRRRHNQVQFQTRDHFWIPQPKLHGAKQFFFVVKPKNGLV